MSNYQLIILQKFWINWTWW